MNLEDHIGSGVISFFNLHLDSEVPLVEHTLKLDETLLAVDYQLGYSVNLRWALWQSIDIDSFILTVASKDNLDRPLLEMRFCCIDYIPKILSFASQFVESLIEEAKPVIGGSC